MDTPPSSLIARPQPELRNRAGKKSMVEFELLSLVTVDLLPLLMTLVPLQLVLGDGRTVVCRGIPAKVQTILDSAGHLRRVGLRRAECRPTEGAPYTCICM